MMPLGELDAMHTAFLNSVKDNAVEFEQILELSKVQKFIEELCEKISAC